jgi:hypothetical protein
VRSYAAIGSSIEFELSAIKEAKMKGNFKIRIVDATGKVNETRFSKIKFSVIIKKATARATYFKLIEKSPYILDLTLIGFEINNFPH